jgi:DNA primase
MIAQQSIQKIYNLPLLDIIQQFVDLKKSGANYVGRSPFVDEKTPSFTVSTSKNIWKCFSSHNGGNNVISFIMALKKCTFVEAVKLAAQLSNINLEFDESEKSIKYQEKVSKQEPLKSALIAIKDWYIEQFNSLDINSPVRAEINKRQYTNEQIEALQIGYAPKGQSFQEFLLKNKLTEAAKQIGIITQENKLLFYDRLMYPILDKWNNCIGFAGRAIGEQKPKWINPPKSIMYDKEFDFYGIHIARQDLAIKQKAILVEGYNDCIALQSAGYSNTLAINSTSITEAHFTTLNRLNIKHLVLAFDNDDAGIKSILKFIPIIIEKGLSVSVALPKVEKDWDEEFRMLDRIKKQKQIIEIDGFEYLLNKKLAPGIGTEKAIEQINKDINKLNIEIDKLNQKKHLQQNIVSQINQDEEPKEFQKINNAIKKIDVEINAFSRTIDEKMTNLQSLQADLSDFSQQKNTIQKELYKIAISCPEPNRQNQYLAKLQSTTKIDKKVIANWQTDLFKNPTSSNTDFKKYNLPDGCTAKIEEVAEIIDKYGFFMSDNQIWKAINDTAPIFFSSIANFEIEILNHMNDDKFPKKLVRMRNVLGNQRIFDTDSANFNTLDKFRNMSTAHGNFKFRGRADDLDMLTNYLFDQMGSGRKVDSLGWQVDGFWAWNNGITIPIMDNFPSNHPKHINIDENGMFIYNSETFYLPSANLIYRNNPIMYTSQKKLMIRGANDLSLYLFVQQMINVHRGHSMFAFLFATASLFQDVIQSEIRNFPLILFYGAPSSGKDQLSKCVRSLFGDTQAPINLASGISTAKAHIRELAQFQNTISEFSEYKNGDSKIDEMLKGIWDRNGYKRGTIESRNSVEEIPVLSSVILTGNEYPVNDALITRLIWCEFSKNAFSLEEKKEYEILDDMIKKGISHFTVELLQLRQDFVNKFKHKFRFFQSELKENKKLAHITIDRIIQNLSVLGATYQILLEANYSLPFNMNDLMEHIIITTENQMRKLNTSSPAAKFWDLFVYGMRHASQYQIKLDLDYRIDGNELKFNWTQVYGIIQKEWWSRYQESCPAKTNLKEQLTKQGYFINDKRAERFGEKSTSVVMFDINQLPNKADLLNAHEWQMARDKDNFSSFTNTSPNSTTEISDNPFFD